jgi:hypothetical protein
MERFNKQDIVQAISDQGANSEDTSLLNPAGRTLTSATTSCQTHSKTPSPSWCPNTTAELRAHAKSQPAGQVDCRPTSRPYATFGEDGARKETSTTAFQERAGSAEGLSRRGALWSLVS